MLQSVFRYTSVNLNHAAFVGTVHNCRDCILNIKLIIGGANDCMFKNHIVNYRRGILH